MRYTVGLFGWMMTLMIIIGVFIWFGIITRRKEFRGIQREENSSLLVLARWRTRSMFFISFSMTCGRCMMTMFSSRMWTKNNWITINRNKVEFVPWTWTTSSWGFFLFLRMSSRWSWRWSRRRLITSRTTAFSSLMSMIIHCWWVLWTFAMYFTIRRHNWLNNILFGFRENRRWHGFRLNDCWCRRACSYWIRRIGWSLLLNCRWIDT